MGGQTYVCTDIKIGFIMSTWRSQPKN